MARTMLDEHRTPIRFWVDAISIACYISNQIFMRPILNLTPFEICFGHKPSISHLRTFWLQVLVLKSGNLDKFESRSSDGIFLGLPSWQILQCLTLRLTPLLSHVM
jgi:hypothetical protein